MAAESVLNTVLAVLLVVLLLCWYNKKQECFTVSNEQKYYDQPETNNPFEYMCDSCNSCNRKSMNEVETLLNPMPYNDELMKKEIPGLRWETEGMYPVDDSVKFDFYKLRDSALGLHPLPNKGFSGTIIEGETVTPDKTAPKRTKCCTGFSQMVLGNYNDIDEIRRLGHSMSYRSGEPSSYLTT